MLDVPAGKADTGDVAYEGLKQVGVRVEAPILDLWNSFVAHRLGDKRAHFVCALLTYLAAGDEVRQLVQGGYLQFRQTGHLAISPLPAAKPSPLSADEQELLVAYRGATDKAKEEAIVNLLDESVSSSRRSDTGEMRDHRVG